MEPLVSICCLTYNHEKYVRTCFDGFVSQKTSFGIEILVHDDASTDGTIDIIREYERKYPDIFKPYIQEKNQYSQGKGYVGMQINSDRAKGKYIALCEGDDYWTDPYKLQKQVDFMESNLEYIACFHNAKVDCDGRLSLFNRLNEKKIPTTEDLIKRKWFISTQTLLYRNVPIEYPDWTKYVVNGDYLLELLLAKEGEFRYMDDVMAVYRRHEGSISDGLNHNQIMMFDKLIFLLQNMKVLYGGKCSTAFDESIANYQKQKEEIERIIKYPYLKLFKKSFYKRMMRKVLGK